MATDSYYNSTGSNRFFIVTRMLVDIVFDIDRLEEEEIEKSTVPFIIGTDYIGYCFVSTVDCLVTTNTSGYTERMGCDWKYQYLSIARFLHAMYGCICYL
jgi:hypothetical protein